MYLFAREMNRKKDLDVYSLICDYDKINFKEEKYFHFAKSYKESDMFLIKILKTHKAISRIKPDAIIQHGLTNESCLMALYCFIRRIKFVFMFAHDLEVQKRFQSSGKKCYLFRFIMKFSSLIVVQNKIQFELLKFEYDLHKSKIILLYNGFPLKKRIKKNYKKVLWVARSDKWKRPELFIKLADLNPEIPFTMICPDSGDTDFYLQLVSSAKKINNLEFIKFVPFDEIDKYFEEAYLFVNTSDYEGYPQTFIQAVMNCIPIFSLNVDPDSFIVSNECGMVFNGDFEKMNRELSNIFNNKALYKKLSDNSYHYFLQKHDIKSNVKLLMDYLN